MPDLKDLLQFVAQKANAPLIHKTELRKAFRSPPKTIRELPKHYLNHLRDVLSDPRKLRLALTDITPLSLATNVLTLPATLKLLQMYPHRRAETLMGAVGNVLGGQIMQRTGIAGGVLGGLSGEALGRLLARPFTSGARKRLPSPITNRLQTLRDTGARIDDVLDAAQQKLGADTMHGPGGAEGMTQHEQHVTEEHIGGSMPELQDIPGQQGNRKSISGRGNTIETGDTLVGNLIRLLGLGTVETHRPGDPFGQHVDFDSIFNGPARGTIPGQVSEQIKARS